MAIQLSPLKTNIKLAPTPKSEPIYKDTVKSADNKELKVASPKAIRALVALMNQHAVIGGAACHWGGPAAMAEMMSSIHALMFNDKSKNWFENFNFINDAGHTENGIYALRALYGHDDLTFNDLKKFRSIESKLTGHGEAHLNPEGVLISNGPLGSGVPQAQGLAIGDKLLQNNRTTICVLSDGGAMEGEAKEALTAIPGLASKGKVNPFVLVVSYNDTKLSGRISKDTYSMEPTFKSLETLGWEMTWVEQGHDLQTVFSSIEKAVQTAQKDSLKPQCVLIKTIKGYGVKSTMESSSGGHGYPLKAYDEKLLSFLEEIYQGETLPTEFQKWAQEILDSKPEAKKDPTGIIVVKEKVQPGFSRAAIKAVKNGLPVFSLSSDLQGSTGIADFHKAYPDHALDLGVCESNMISTAIGLSKLGFVPVVDTFAQFGITKGNLPIIMAGLSEAPVIGLFSHTGFQDAADGASHQATTYIAATAAIPQTIAVSCSCSEEAEAYMSQAIEQFKGPHPESVLFFFGRENHPVSYKPGMTYNWLKAQELKSGNDITIVAHGPMVEYALKAYELLAERGVRATVINHPFVNRPDIDLLKASVEKTGGKILTVEDHQIVGGMGAQIIHALAINGVPLTQVKTLGIDGVFGQSAYTADNLYKKHKLDDESIYEAVMKLLV